MSLTPVVNSPESSHQVFDMVESDQWNKNEQIQNGTIQEWSEPPPPPPAPVITNRPNPEFYNNGMGFNGNGTVPLPPNNISVLERNVPSTNGMYVMNGARPPHNILSPGMIRPNGYNPNILNGNNGYMNAVANGRYVRGPPGWVTTNKVSNGVKKQKRNRTAFTSHQMMELEQEYARTRYLDRNRRIELSEILNLNQRTIKIWFQNRRMKEKKDRAESLEESEEVSTTESSPELINEIPAFIHEQYPVTVTSNEIYNREGMYMEQYPVSSSPSALNPVMPPIPNQVPNDFMPYAPENTYDPQSQCRQVHLQVQQYDPVFDNGMQEVQQEALQVDSRTQNAPSAISDQNWDLSWIRSMQTDDEF